VLLVTISVHAATTDASLDSLLERRQYFQLREVLEQPDNALPAYKKIYYQAFVHNFFHELTTSNKEIDQLLSQYKKQLTDKEISNLLGKKIDNHVKLYQYEQAWKASELLLSKYSSTLTTEDKRDIINSNIIWKGLRKIKPQATVISKDSRIPYKRDLARLINVPVQFSDSSFDFVFDTGANLSVITETNAGKAGLDLLNVFFNVRAITGIEVKANLGVAKELKMGDIVVKNVVFIVFPDSTLSFAGGAYKIRGIIGYPVIEQLQEVRIDKAGFISVPQEATNKSIRNFGMDELTPVINIPVNKDTLAFTFDTGAQQTDLNQPFYSRYQTDIEATGKAYNMQQGGAGGYTTQKAWRVPATTFNVGGQAVQLANLGVKTTNKDSKDKFYYGNLGQDVMSKFRELVINFRYMYVDFVN
jgi:predicted aspartyl protease